MAAIDGGMTLRDKDGVIGSITVREVERLERIEAAAIELEINIKDDTWDSVCEKRKKLREALEGK